MSKGKYPDRGRPMTSITFEIGDSGSKKNTYAIRTNGDSNYIGANAESRAVKAALLGQMEAIVLSRRPHGATWPLMPPFYVDVVFGAKVKTDIDNGLGHVYDCMQAAGMIENDKDVREAHQKYSRAPMTIVTLMEIENYEYVATGKSKKAPVTQPVPTGKSVV